MKKNFDFNNKFEGDVNKDTQSLLGTLGWFGLFFTWWLLSIFVPEQILPSPIKVVASIWELMVGPYYHWAGVKDLFGNLFASNHLLYHIGFSTFVNVLGYLEAVVIAIPLGFLIALYPIPRYLFRTQLDAIRFLPIPAATGIFIAVFGIGVTMKVNFLAVGILVYLIPTVVQRVLETDNVYKQTLQTLGASTSQKLKYLYFPSVISRVFVDIIVLVAISWTYITIIEVINQQGGLGAIVVGAGRGRTDIVYAILALIIGLGRLNDFLLRNRDKKWFKFKYA